MTHRMRYRFYVAESLLRHLIWRPFSQFIDWIAIWCDGIAGHIIEFARPPSEEELAERARMNGAIE